MDYYTAEHQSQQGIISVQIAALKLKQPRIFLQ